MINKFRMNYLRNAECLAFIQAANDLTGKHSIFSATLAPLRETWNDLLAQAAEALKVEEQNETVRLKNEADRYRDRLHGKLFNYLKSILYDERDLRFDRAQQLMNIMKSAGNPVRLPENAESVMLAALCDSLAASPETLDAVGATAMVNDLLKANQSFIELEKQCRAFVSDKKLHDLPALSALCRELIALYSTIIDCINVNVRIAPDSHREFVTDMNVLVAKYDSLLSARNREDSKTGEK